MNSISEVFGVDLRPGQTPMSLIVAAVTSVTFLMSQLKHRPWPESLLPCRSRVGKGYDAYVSHFHWYNFRGQVTMTRITWGFASKEGTLSLMVSNRRAYTRRAIAIVGIGALGIVVVSLMAIAFYTNRVFTDGGNIQFQTAKSFLVALLTNREETAQNYLSFDFKRFVEENCPDRAVIKCVENLVSPEWGEFEDAIPIFSSVDANNRNLMLFYTLWSNIESSSIVVTVSLILQDDKWVVDSLRGFVISEGEDVDSLFLDGSRLDNLIPPDNYANP